VPGCLNLLSYTTAAKGAPGAKCDALFSFELLESN